MSINQGLSGSVREPTIALMKTILWATLSANGNYARTSERHPPKPQALGDFAKETAAHGNFIVGRTTFEEFQANAQRRPSGPPPKCDIVVVSKSLVLPAGAPAQRAADPQAALALLSTKGHATAVVVGGEHLHNAFLAADLVDELVLLITPWFEDEGLKLILPKGERRETKLIEHASLGGGVIKLRYALGPKDGWCSPS